MQLPGFMKTSSRKFATDVVDDIVFEKWVDAIHKWADVDEHLTHDMAELSDNHLKHATI